MIEKLKKGFNVKYCKREAGNTLVTVGPDSRFPEGIEGSGRLIRTVPSVVVWYHFLKNYPGMSRKQRLESLSMLSRWYPAQVAHYLFREVRDRFLDRDLCLRREGGLFNAHVPTSSLYILQIDERIALWFYENPQTKGELIKEVKPFVEMFQDNLRGHVRDCRVRDSAWMEELLVRTLMDKLVSLHAARTGQDRQIVAQTLRGREPFVFSVSQQELCETYSEILTTVATRVAVEQTHDYACRAACVAMSSVFYLHDLTHLVDMGHTL
ncbi:hypothetical protein GNI_092070 [Gregarina niphandrodes]|uniref:Uncharacterized protein n=1 Tax=Gregarina niphandrodes TaxID=110365 RepID=A0A023B5A9_GRENI|nr:hypothetical protein GNI_092070 [Gregarina niphandrodes]EZG59596.1 hypothetical protein GNI_092070 [Gregarina niphandrodes]|eukprot:XP_011130886.1 hypothetical protein GNI_092070 [Gregarina niphandrodes]